MRLKALFTVAALAGALAFSACGGGSDGDAGNAASSALRPVDWPLFGRVPERTHYLPRRSRSLDPPLRKEWSISTHALIEFPPAVAGGVAYVVNKFGNAKAVRLRDRKVLWERVADPRNAGKPTDVTAPVYHRGKVFFAFVDGHLLAVDAASGRTAWNRRINGHLESSPLAVVGALYLGTDTTNAVALRASDGKVLWNRLLPSRSESSPLLD
ncbi:MAG TPA: PQQ-binding-like beta-propeller repeat protein, partial [Solirubrobacterales bacterium]|nr:PQQ-binding-like beta-propeller repeat protein [Solirubrobacterales bacterium]